jgi:hypothetical protein
MCVCGGVCVVVFVESASEIDIYIMCTYEDMEEQQKKNLRNPLKRERERERERDHGRCSCRSDSRCFFFLSGSS